MFLRVQLYVLLENTKKDEIEISLNLLSQWFPKYGSRPKHGSQRVKKWVAPRRSKPGLYIFTVPTACLFLSVA